MVKPALSRGVEESVLADERDAAEDSESVNKRKQAWLVANSSLSLLRPR